jgi:ribosomal protein S27E
VNDVAPPQSQQRQFPCRQCGANLVFAPGTTSLRCEYCGTQNDIAPLVEQIDELDFHAHASGVGAGAETQETLTVHCNACGAETDFTHDVSASKCPFCGAAIVATAASRKQIKPRSLLPFHVTRQQADDLVGCVAVVCARRPRPHRAAHGHRRRLRPRVDVRQRHLQPLHRPARR